MTESGRLLLTETAPPDAPPPGLALAALRYRTGGLWLPIGYHFAWNYVQTAVVGSVNAAPSIRPVECTGPELWLGRPGTPEWGLLAIIVNLVVALLCIGCKKRTV